jgi:PAS domain S-box-containing protein
MVVLRGDSATLVETADALIVTLDPTGEITYFNRACERATGFSRGEVIGRKVWEFPLPESYVEPVKRVFTNLGTEELPNHFEVRWLTRNGREKIVSWTSKIIKDVEGNVSQIIGTGLDITEREQVEEALRQSEETCQSMIDLANIIIGRYDLEGRRTFANNLFAQRVKKPLQELLKGKLGDLLSPEDRKDEWRLFRKCVETGKPLRGASHELKIGEETLYMRGDFSPIFDANGRVSGVQVTSVDITELVEAQEALRQSEATYQNVIDLANVRIGRYDLEGRRTFVNQLFAQRGNKSLQEMLKGKLADLLSPEDRKDEWRLFRKCIETGKLLRGTAHKLKVGEQPHYLRGDFAPILDVDGKVSGVQVTSVDVTELVETQEALRQSEATYRNVIDLANVRIGRYDLDGRRTFVNEALVDLYGKPQEELLKGELADHILPADREMAWTAFRRCIRSKTSIQGIVARYERDGRMYYTRGNYSPILDPNGDVVGAQVTSVDITELMETQQALQLRTEEVGSLFEISNILSQPGDFEEKATLALEILADIVKVERATLRLLSEDEKALRVTASAGSEMPKAPPLDPLSAFGEGLSGLAFRQGQPVVVNDYPSHPHALPYLLDIGINSAAALPISMGDRKLGALGIGSMNLDHFTPDRVRLLEAIANEMGPLLENAGLTEAERQSREMYQSLLEATGSVVVRVNRERKRTFLAGETHSRPVEEFQAGEFADHLVPEDREAARALLQETFRTGQSVQGYVTRHVSGGKLRHLASNWEPIKDSDGNVVEIQTTSTDITDQIEAEHQRTQSERLEALSHMAGGIAHDVNNALAMVMLWNSIAETRSRSQEVRQALRNVSKAAQDCAESMKRLRRFSEPGRPDTRERLQISEIVEECIAFTRPRWKDEAEAKDIYIEVDKEHQQVSDIVGNPSELREVLVNLIQNSIEAMPEGGKLSLKTYQKKDSVCVVVSDTGTGIDRRHIPHIFDPFYTTKGQEGSGLGLSAAYGIITAHGGEIRVQSSKRRGTSFTLRLPAAGTPDKEDKPDEKPHQGRMIGDRKYNILAVEDERLVREALTYILEEQGHQVVSVEEGVAALEIFEQKPFDIVLLDLGLPGMNGYKVAEGAKKIRKEVPILLVTGWGDDLDLKRIRALGISGVVHKPYHPHELVGAVEKAMEKK